MAPSSFKSNFNFEELFSIWTLWISTLLLSSLPTNEWEYPLLLLEKGGLALEIYVATAPDWKDGVDAGGKKGGSLTAVAEHYELSRAFACVIEEEEALWLVPLSF